MCIHKYYFPAINSHKNLNLSLSLLCLDTPKLLILWEILIVRYGHEICILSTTRNKYFWFYDKKFLHNNTRNVCKQSFGYLVSWCHDDPNLSRHPRHFPSQLLVIYSWPNSNSILLFPAHTTQYQTQVRLTQTQSCQIDTWGRPDDLILASDVYNPILWFHHSRVSVHKYTWRQLWTGSGKFSAKVGWLDSSHLCLPRLMVWPGPITTRPPGARGDWWPASDAG